MKMEYVNRLLEETDFLERLKALEAMERDRSYCRHGLSHLLDVARIGWIAALEQELNLEKEQLYLAALLHDLGRREELSEGTPHEEAGMSVAAMLLRKIGYPQEKSLAILTAIGGHRGNCVQASDLLTRILQWADKRSRNCFFCPMRESCRWPKERQNGTIGI